MQYNCSNCNEYIELSTQSKGFGRFNVTCFLCGGKASFLPQGAPSSATIHQAPTNEPEHTPTPPSPTPSAAENLTLPVQANPDLLAADALDKAQTLHFQRTQDLPEEPSTILLPSSELSMDNVDEDDIPTRAILGFANRKITSTDTDLRNNPAPKQAPYNPTPIPSATHVARSAAKVQEALRTPDPLPKQTPTLPKTSNTLKPHPTPSQPTPAPTQHTATYLVLALIVLILLGVLVWLFLLGGLEQIQA